MIFVYNADSGLFSTVTDFAHKIISPDTYECNLCKLTYGNFAMKNEWRDFLESLESEKVFLHRDEFKKQFPQIDETVFPCVFILKDGQTQLLLNAEEINRVSDIAELKNIIMGKLGL